MQGVQKSALWSELFTGAVRAACGAAVYSRGFDFSPDRQRVYFANHSSHLDFLVIFASLPLALRRVTRPVAAHDYWSKGRIRRFLSTNVFRAILIDRSRKPGQDDPLHEVHCALVQGDSIIFFPEGTRSRDGSLLSFKSGLYHLASRHPLVELVPVYLRNLNRILPKGEIVPLPLLSSVVFGAPLALRQGEPKGEFLARAEHALRELMV
jgi:1-acyl-sn-glycerol-3-phosphate acyltransferase